MHVKYKMDINKRSWINLVVVCPFVFLYWLRTWGTHGLYIRNICPADRIFHRKRLLVNVLSVTELGVKGCRRRTRPTTILCLAEEPVQLSTFITILIWTGPALLKFLCAHPLFMLVNILCCLNFHCLSRRC